MSMPEGGVWLLLHRPRPRPRKRPGKSRTRTSQPAAGRTCLFGPKLTPRRSQPGGRRVESNRAGLSGRLHDDLRETVEHAPLARFVRFVAARIAVADTNDFSGAAEFEMNQIIRDRDHAALGVEDGGRHDAEV